ncbi:hypothetical protein QFC20_001461 [Naganishia adeliensis]|uniref:Uncharacterized protein n=1 Tax=Naganishia adeliensis TaxID=92952 RepID=A0ACC2WVM3_9TREE|nr:hypothetical protein QFC20_001461 [Naganishia adeliensis]
MSTVELVKRVDSRPNSFQTYTIIAACIYFFAINALWHLPFLRDLISGFKLFVVATHEFCHILVGMIVGGEVIRAFLGIAGAEGILIGLWFGDHGNYCLSFTSLLGWPPSVWAGIWILYSMLVFVAAIFAGIIVWKKTTDEMYEDASHFLPTR